jgi:DNA-binding response OmpR family regulator
MKSHILIVTDSRDEQRILVDALGSSDYRFSIAPDGRSGYRLAVATTPDLVLLDMDLAQMGGMSTCRILKETILTSHIPVIFISSGDDLAMLANALSVADDYVFKPLSIAEVQVRVRARLAMALDKAAALNRSHGGKVDQDEVLVQAAMRYLLSHLGDRISLAGLTDALGISEKRIACAFRQRCGSTIFDFVRQERMRLAEHLLVETTLRIADISAETGFSSVANFSTAFRAYAGTSPSIFRRSRHIERIHLLGNTLH